MLENLKTFIFNKLGDSCNEKENITNDEADFPGCAQEIEKTLEDLKNEKDIKITDSIVIEAFNEKINEVLQPIITAAYENPDFQSLFQGMQQNDIISLDKDTTIWTKMKFDWSGNNDFGISDYKTDYWPKIKFWYEVIGNLNIKVNYKNAVNKVQSYVIVQNYTFYYANKAGNIPIIIDIASSNISDKLKDFMTQVDLLSEKIDFKREWQKKLIPKITDCINNRLKFAKKSDLVIGNDATIPHMENGLFSDFVASKIGYNAYPYFAKDKTTFSSEYLLAAMIKEQDYQNALTAWLEDKSTAENKDDIFFFGNYQLNNWSFQGLFLKPITINLVVSENVNRIDQLKQVTKAFSELLASDGLLKDKIKSTNEGQTFSMALSVLTFDKLVNDITSTFNDAIIQEKAEIRKIAKNKQLISDNDNFEFNTHYFGADIRDKPVHDLLFHQFLDPIKNQVNYQPESWELWMIMSLNGFYVNFSAGGVITNIDSNYINDFWITRSDI